MTPSLDHNSSRELPSRDQRESVAAASSSSAVGQVVNLRPIDNRPPLVFVAAEPQEFDGLLRHTSNITRLSWSPIAFARSAELNGQSVVLLANGPGPDLAAAAAVEALLRVHEVSALISTGFCGALDNGLEPCDIFVADAVNGHTAAGPASDAPFKRGSLISENQVASTREDKRKLREAGAAAVEMEAAGVARIARQTGTPFFCVRVVTDAASETLPLDFNKLRDARGRFSRVRILAAACRQPFRVFPELMKLQRTCKSASVALGDFIANCRF